MNAQFNAALLGLFLCLTGNNLHAADFDKTKEMSAFDGYFTFYYDEKEDAIYLEVKELNEDFLYVQSLASGVGSNDIGLDRGQLGAQRVLHFRRSGPKLLLVEDNLMYRASSDNKAEVQSIKEAFAFSVLAAFPILEEKEEALLIDISEFLLQDAHGVVQTLRNRKQGSYQLDLSRSAIYMERTKNFPKNTEFEVLLTFMGEPEGREIHTVTANPAAISVRQHHSFVQLPDDNYQARKFDPRMGFFELSFSDYSVPIDRQITQKFITRHRLKKKNPEAEKSEAIEPIIYYLDPGTPEPVRSALLDGARWWNQAFEEAGFINAFQVELLPEDADPLDIRYNVIQWVHRSTRGWSYGSSVVDPRTGEILKGHVSLGSLRVRQDYLIANGLLNPFEKGDESEAGLKMALARLRQLSAHEVGHTLGLAHNYSSSMDGRASVMDYPHPKVDIVDGKLDLSNAYDQKIGEWDKMAIKYGYQDFPKSINEEEGLGEIISETYTDKNLSFISDQDARPKGSAHPRAHLWDNGSNAAQELNHLMEVRKIALDQFSEKAILPGQSMSMLEEALAPIYFMHRYQIEAAAKVLGGLNYTYAMRGDGQDALSMVSPDLQYEALSALINTLSPSELALNTSLLELIPPKPLGFGRGRESMPSHLGVVFDPISIAKSAAEMTLEFLFHPTRANRLVDFKYRDKNQPGLKYVLDDLIDFCMNIEVVSGLEREISHMIIHECIEHVKALQVDPRSSTEVKAIASHSLNDFKEKLIQLDHDAIQEDHAIWHYTIHQIEDFQKDPSTFTVPQKEKAPDGSPIGANNCSFGHY